MSVKALWSQNKHIVITAVSIFIVSLATILFFTPSDSSNYLRTDVLHGESHGSEEEPEHEVEKTGNKYVEILTEEDKPYFVLNKDGKIISTSVEFIKLMGEKEEKLKDAFIFDFIAKEHREQVFKHYREAFANRQEAHQTGPFRIEFNQQEKIVLFSFIPLEDGSEEILIEVNDVTDDLEKLNNQMEQQEEKDDETRVIVRNNLP